MAAFLSKELSSRNGNQQAMAYFFCDDKDERLRTANAVLASWLAQLLTLVPSSIVHFPELEDSKQSEKNISWNFESLWRVFQRIVIDANTGNICLLVDALGMSL